MTKMPAASPPTAKPASADLPRVGSMALVRNRHGIISSVTPFQAALELAMAGQQGLDLKDPTPKHTLKAFPGAFSGMKIVSYMYAAFQQFMPGADVGIDLSKEYAAVTRH